VGITAGSREVPGRIACDRRHTYRIIIIIIIIISRSTLAAGEWEWWDQKKKRFPPGPELWS